MSASNVLIVIAVVLLASWGFGAYNRLVRERSQAIRAFADVAAAIEARSAVLLRMAHAQLVHVTEPAVVNLWHDVEHCVQQAANAAAHAGLKPLEGPRMAPLVAAQHALNTALQDVRERSQDLAGAPWPAEVQTELSRCDARLLTQSETFDALVTDYNASARQWPTRAVAWLFGLHPAQPLRHAASQAESGLPRLGV